MGNTPGGNRSPRVVHLDEERVFVDYARENPEDATEFNIHLAYVSKYMYNWATQQIDESSINPWVCIFTWQMILKDNSIKEKFYNNFSALPIGDLPKELYK